MSAKITLYSEEELIKKIKHYAKEHNTSVSKIVNTFFKNLLQKNQPNKEKSQITDRLTGKLKDAKIDESVYEKYLEEKYL